MPKKVRSEKCSGGWCKNHLLQMLPLKSNDCYFRKKTKLRFCPAHDAASNAFNNPMPIVNQDRRHYTPCFILQEEHIYYRDNEERLLGSHNLKLQSSEQGTILVPKHGRKKNYCSVCKSEYEDYLQHTEQLSHKDHLRNNRFSKYILETQHEIALLTIKRDFQLPLDTTKLVEQTKDRQICAE